ncbi:MAG: transcription elongation factor GreA [Parcubacteria group bacterium]
MQSEQEYLTKEKFQELEKELAHLQTTKRKEIAEALEYAKSLGDLSENQEYHEARDAQVVIEDRISRIESMLKSAIIVSTQNTDVINVGSVVTLQKNGDNSKKVYTMVGSEESNASLGKVSIRSPLGMSALGKKKGETFSFETPSGTMSYKIIDIK